MREDLLKVSCTGATGLVGRALVSKLVALGRFNVLALTRLKPSESINGVKYIPVGNITPQTQWRVGLMDVNILVHCAARVHVMSKNSSSRLTDYRTVNFYGTLNLARQAASAGVKRFVFISSIKVNGDSTRCGRAFTETDAPNPQDAYSLSKHEAEEALRQLAFETGMEVVIIRPPLVYGPGVKANLLLREDGPCH